MYNAAVKTDTNSRYTLKIVHDTDALDPREGNDNFSTLVCWHRRYDLGDKHDYNDGDDFFRALVRENYSEKAVFEYVKEGRSDSLTLEYNASTHEWELKEYDDYFKKWFDCGSYTPPLIENSGILCDDIIENMTTKDLKLFAEEKHLIEPLYLYDHTIQSISMRSFHGRAHHADWDSGVVGFAYVSHEDISKEYGDTSPENIEKARQLMSAEVETYDCYIRGECYGFQLFRDGEEVDSCWGFLGSFDEALEGIREYLPEDAVPLVESTAYGDDDPEYEPGDEEYQEEIE